MDVLGVDSGWLDRLPIDDRREQGQPVIDWAFRAVRMDMLGDAKADFQAAVGASAPRAACA